MAAKRGVDETSGAKGVVSPGNEVLEAINIRQPIAPQVYERLRRAITTLAMLPSEALSEKDLSLQLGVSRTPVREALIRLADEGLIDILPQRGSFVAPIRIHDVEEAQFIRESLEVAVVKRLAHQCSAQFVVDIKANLARQELAVADGEGDLFLELDEAFHRGFCEEARLSRSWRVIQTVKLQMDRVRYLSLPDPAHLRTLLAQHWEIVRAIEHREPELASSAMAAHLQEVLRTAQRLSIQRAELIER
ncbi:GntR family transcriptional regulator [Neorhizobium sp. DT-125]|uniref:GntR family transcriptional regulator n=1 Tax=Neorhizobium sp. DT-125 TaxID=3396163 RepID=UPI003F53F038